MTQPKMWRTALAVVAATVVAGAASAQTVPNPSGSTRSDPSSANQKRTGDAVPRDAAGSTGGASGSASAPMSRPTAADNGGKRSGTRSDPSTANRARTGDAMPPDATGSAPAGSQATGSSGSTGNNKRTDKGATNSSGTRSDSSPANRARTGDAVPKDAAGSSTAPK